MGGSSSLPSSKSLASMSCDLASSSAVTGMANSKVAPEPRALRTRRRPPMILTSWEEMERPRPVPPYSRVVLLSACWNGWKMDFCTAGAMPMPVSLTENDT